MLVDIDRFMNASAFIEYLDKPEWRVLSFTKDALTVKVNMDTFAMEPKN